MRYFNKDSRDFNFIHKFEAGLVLTGADAKSLRVQPPQFLGSKIEVINGQPVIFNLKIPRYKYSQNQITDTTPERNLLLSGKEIAKLISLRHQKYMIIPIAIYLQGKWFKVEIGIGRKMRKFEKRDKIKNREVQKSLH
ncbi:SsrA-binding protein [Candidatus Shapirobacteria bacterium]|jgi:SsrA-binding protein|nr:SsrA-binding protein [Candidatus Shapirobacteria bacterium]